MPLASNVKAAEMHTLAMHAHQAAVASHAQGDHLSGHEYSRQTLEHATRAFEESQKLLRESEAAAGETPHP